MGVHQLSTKLGEPRYLTGGRKENLTAPWWLTTLTKTHFLVSVYDDKQKADLKEDILDLELA